MQILRPLAAALGCLLLTACETQVQPALQAIPVKSCSAHAVPAHFLASDGTEAPAPAFSAMELQWQGPELPNGCEVTSLAMLLTAAGCPADKVDLYETYLPTEAFKLTETARFGPSPETAYAGDATSVTGGGDCFEGPILAAGDAWLAAWGGRRTMQDLTGLNRAELDDLLAAGTPVVAWVTREYAPPAYASYFSWVLPDGSIYVPFDNLHCVVVTAVQDSQYPIADPLEGWQTVPAQEFWDSFSAMGCRAVTVSMNE